MSGASPSRSVAPSAEKARALKPSLAPQSEERSPSALTSSIFGAGNFAVQRSAMGGCSCGGVCDDCRANALQRKGESAAPARAPSFDSTLARSTSTRALDAPVKSKMESGFATTFDDVRVHTDSAAVDAAKQINAHAFTIGRDVYFGGGKYQPGTQSGDKLLAHELTHVVQQRSGSPAPGLKPIDPASSLKIDASGEAEADRVAENISSGRPAGKIGASAPGSVQGFLEFPIEPPVELPFEFPIEPPIEIPIEPPIEAPFEPPIEAPFEPPFEAPFEPPIEAPFEPPFEAPFEPPFEAPFEPPFEAPFEPPFEAPFEPPFEAPGPGPSPFPFPFPYPYPYPIPWIGPWPQPQPDPDEDDDEEPECGSQRLPLSVVSFFPGPLGQGGRVKASPLTRCPGNTVGSEPDNRIYRSQFDCITAAGQRGSWVRAHILHGETSSSGPRNLHGPGNDMRNLIIADQSLNQSMRRGAEGPALNLVYGARNAVLWYDSKVDSYAPGLDYFAQSISVDFGFYDTTTRTEGPRIGGGTFSLARTPPNCPVTAHGSVPPPAGSSTVSFDSTLKICRHVLNSRNFEVTDGGLEVHIDASLFDASSGDPTDRTTCPIDRYYVSLEQPGIIWDTEISTTAVPVGLSTPLVWRHLENGEYYLKIWTDNDNPNCCLTGTISVSTFSAPKPPPRPRGVPEIA